MSKLAAETMITLHRTSTNHGRAVIGIRDTLELSLKEIADSMLCSGHCQSGATVGQWFEDDGRYSDHVRIDDELIDYDPEVTIESYPVEALPLSTTIPSDLPSDIADMTYDQLMEVLDNG